MMDPIRCCSIQRYSWVLALIMWSSVWAGAADAQWRLLKLTPRGVDCVAFRDSNLPPQVGYCATTAVDQRFGDTAQLYRTVDGGRTWKEVILRERPDRKGRVCSFAFKDSVIGWFTNEAGGCYKTGDGGLTWDLVLPGQSTNYPEHIYYNPANKLLLLSQWMPWQMVSTDEGATWTQFNVGRGNWNGIAFSDPNIGVVTPVQQGLEHPPPNGTARTTDGGRTWIYTDYRFEAWQPCAFKNSGYFFAAAEMDSLKAPGSIYRSTDSGQSWTVTWRMPTGKCRLDGYSSGCIRANGCNQLFIQTCEGLLTSMDSGITWLPIGGPKILVPDRDFWCVGPYLYAGWLYKGQVGLWTLDVRQLLPLFADTVRLQSASCSKTSANIRFNLLNLCPDTTGKLVSASLHGSGAFGLSDNVLPRTLAGADSLLISYTPINDLGDTGLLVLHFSMNGFEYDTTVTLLGSYTGGSRSGALAVETGATGVTAVLAPGDTNQFVVKNVEQVDPTTDTLAFDLSFDCDALDVLSVSVATGWKIISQYRTSEGWHFSLQRTQSDVVEAGTALVTVRVKAALSRNVTTPIILQQSVKDSVINCGMTSITIDGKCATPLLRHFMQTGSIFELLTIEPNPARNEVTIGVTESGVRSRGSGIEMEVFDLLGVERLRGTVNSPKTPIDVSSLAAGTYFLRLSEGGTVRTRRFVIAR